MGKLRGQIRDNTGVRLPGLSVVGGEVGSYKTKSICHVGFSKLLFLIGIFSGPSGEIGRHIGLKIRRFVNNGRTGSIPVSGTTTLKKQILPIYLLIF